MVRLWRPLVVVGGLAVSLGSHAFLLAPPSTPSRTSHSSLHLSGPVDQSSQRNDQWPLLPQGLVKAALSVALVLPSLFVSPGPSYAQGDLTSQLQQLSKQVLLQEKLLSKAKDKTRRIEFPVVQGGARLSSQDVNNAIDRIKVLGAYLDEMERDIFKREWKYIGGFQGVFADQEEAFVKLIEALYPTNSQVDQSSRQALSYEAQRMFLELDNLVEAARYQRPKSAERAYAQIALAYDRFLKAGDLYSAYDPITSTEPFYANIPGRAIVYDSNATPQVKDSIVVLGGPDKGKTGRLIAVDDSKAVIKLDTNGRFTEVKIIKMADVGKQLPDA